MFRVPSRVLRHLSISLLLGTTAVTAAQAGEVVPLEASAVSLEPGDFVWQPEQAKAGPVEIHVSLAQQLAYVFRGGTLIGVSTVSTGKPGHDTPIGSFEILQKNREHYSNLYDNAPMPFMQRLTWDGIALHGGAVPGYPASHGCIRLPERFARLLFGVTELGASVHVTDGPPAFADPQLDYASISLTD